jgi:hypothetical protein
MRIIGIAALLLIVVASAALAQSPYLYLFTYDDTGGGHKVGFGARSEAVLGHDSGDLSWGAHVFGPSEYGLVIYKENGKYGWDTDPGFYVLDARAPLAAGQTEVFEDIYLWAGNAVSLPSFQIHLDSFYMLPGSLGMTYAFDLVSVATGVTYNGPTHWGADSSTITLPFVTTDDPTKGYRFRATVTAPVPEPSSLLILSAACMAASGSRLRRRQR